VLARQSRSATLLVVGASGHHGAAAFWLGSTARFVARHSACPVAVVRGPAGADVTKRVIVGFDGSPESEPAVRWAADEADRCGAALLIVHCWLSTYRAVDLRSAQVHDVGQVEAARLLDRVVEGARERCGVDVTGMLLEDNPITALLSMSMPGDVLVLGSPEHGSIMSGVLGSTVNGVLEESVVPVVIVPSGVGPG
jgi:nucleotide-binding universal stress UspA family protein